MSESSTLIANKVNLVAGNNRSGRTTMMCYQAAMALDDDKTDMLYIGEEAPDKLTHAISSFANGRFKGKITFRCDEMATHKDIMDCIQDAARNRYTHVWIDHNMFDSSQLVRTANVFTVMGATVLASTLSRGSQMTEDRQNLIAFAFLPGDAKLVGAFFFMTGVRESMHESVDCCVSYTRYNENGSVAMRSFDIAERVKILNKDEVRIDGKVVSKSAVLYAAKLIGDPVMVDKL